VAAPDTAGAWYRRWRLVAVDGTVFDVPDTGANSGFFVEGQHPLAMRAAMAAARVSPGRAVRWALAASTAVSASVTAFFTLRFFSQVPIRLAPLRRIAAGTW
jgi:hypothetical protein